MVAGAEASKRPSWIVGDAVAMRTGFAVSLLSSVGSKTHAAVALAPQGVDGTREVDLGPVHGDVPPPAIAEADGYVYAAVSDGDAGGGALRIAKVDTVTGRVAWGWELHEANDDSNEVSIAVVAGRVLVAWDAWYEEGGRGILSFSSASVTALTNGSAPRALLSDERSVSAPRMVSGGSGLWLAYLASADREADVSTKERAKRVESGEEWVEEGPSRSVEVVRLDAQGKVTSRAVSVSPPNVDVASFQLAPFGSDAAVVAWRSNTPTGGAGGELSVSVVRADGSVTSRPVEVERLGPGGPSLLTSSRSGVWLVAAADDDRAQVGWFDASAPLAGAPSLWTDEELGALTPLADGSALLALEQGQEGPVLVEVSCPRR